MRIEHAAIRLQSRKDPARRNEQRRHGFMREREHAIAGRLGENFVEVAIELDEPGTSAGSPLSIADTAASILSSLAAAGEPVFDMSRGRSAIAGSTIIEASHNSRKSPSGGSGTARRRGEIEEMRRRNARPFAAVALDQSALLQEPNAFAHGRAVHAELPGELYLRR